MQGKNLEKSELLERLHTKIDEIDWELAKSDVAMFIPDKQRLAIWSASFFHDLMGHLRVADNPPLRISKNRFFRRGS